MRPLIYNGTKLNWIELSGVQFGVKSGARFENRTSHSEN